MKLFAHYNDPNLGMENLLPLYFYMGSVVNKDLGMDVFELKFITVCGADQIDLVKNTYDVNTKPGNHRRQNQQTFSAHH